MHTLNQCYGFEIQWLNLRDTLVLSGPLCCFCKIFQHDTFLYFLSDCEALVLATMRTYRRRSKIDLKKRMNRSLFALIKFYITPTIASLVVRSFTLR